VDPRAKNLLIVVAEDDVDDQFLTKGVLQKEFPNANIVIFGNGFDLWNYLVGLKDTRNMYFPDVVVLDLNLPLLDGFGVLSRVKEEKALCMIPFVVLSTSSETENKERALKLGVIDYIVKPNAFAGYMLLINAIIKLNSSSKHF